MCLYDQRGRPITRLPLAVSTSCNFGCVCCWPQPVADGAAANRALLKGGPCRSFPGRYRPQAIGRSRRTAALPSTTSGHVCHPRLAPQAGKSARRSRDRITAC